MKKFVSIIFAVSAFSPTAFASDNKRHIGGTIITVPSMASVSAPVKVKQSVAANRRALFEYGVEEKGITKSEREYREFLSYGTYSRTRSIGRNSYAKMGRGSYAGNGRARAVYGKDFNPPRRSSGFARISNRGGISRGLRGNNGTGFASLNSNR